jgi:outer membrane protein assembly factor BamB
MRTSRVQSTIIALCLALSLGILSWPATMGNSAEEATLLIDFGDGEYLWAESEIGENRTAINLTERVMHELGLDLEIEWFSFGGFVKKIGEEDCEFPFYWHFYYWNSSVSEWTISSVGQSDYILQDGDVIALYCVADYSDWSSPLPVPAPVHKHPSTMFRSTLRNGGTAHGKSPETNTTLWDLDTEKTEIDSTAAVGWGKVFITGTNGFHAIDQNTGRILWQDPDIRGMSSPALFDGKVIVGAANGNVYSLDADTGDVLWSKHVQERFFRQSITSSPKVWNNLVFIGTFNETGTSAGIVALNIENGTVVWHNDTASVYASSPAIDGGVLYVGLAGIAVDYGFSFNPPYGLLALSALNGSFLWMFETENRTMSSPLVHEDRIYFTSWDGYLYSMDKNGDLDWKLEIGESVSSIAASDGILYVGTGVVGSDGKLLAIETDRTVLWEYEVDGAVQASPLVVDGKVCFATNEPEGKIYCLNTSNGNLIWSYQPSPANWILSSPVVADGILFIASDNGHVYAFADKVEDVREPPEPNAILVAATLVGLVLLILMIAVMARRPKK